jgi:hypothetical protein
MRTFTRRLGRLLRWAAEGNRLIVPATVWLASQEGIVAKRKDDPYGDRTQWLKIKNPAHTQMKGRRELFERRWP